MKERLAHFITHDILSQNNLVIGDDDDLLGSGLLDSLSVMSLVHFIEQETDIVVPAEDVTIENFESMALIAAYVERRTAGR